MTREEAIRCLSVHSSTNGSGLCTDEQHYEAKQMAINALEREQKFLDAGYKNGRVEFMIGGRKFMVKEMAQ